MGASDQDEIEDDPFAEIETGTISATFMSMWNSFVSDRNIAETGGPEAFALCQAFLSENAQAIVEQNMARDFLNHIHHLFELCIMSPRNLSHLAKILSEARVAYETAQQDDESESEDVDDEEMQDDVDDDNDSSTMMNEE